MSEQLGQVIDDVEEVAKDEPTAKGRPKTGFIAVLDKAFIKAGSKKELKALLEKKGINEVTIIRGKVLPTARVTRLSF